MRTLKINTLPSVKEQPWCDRDYLLFHSCFQILVDWVEKEDGLNDDVEHQDIVTILRDLYNWWKENSEIVDCVEDLAQEKLEQLVKYRRFLWC